MPAVRLLVSRALLRSPAGRLSPSFDISRYSLREFRLMLGGSEAMCNLYKMTKTAQVAKLFGAAADPPGNAGDTVYPGYPGIVVAADASGLRVRQMIWGFPLTLKGKNGQPL